jgi:hypothetical protein
VEALNDLHSATDDEARLFAEMVLVHGSDMGFDLMKPLKNASDEEMAAFRCCSLLTRLLMQRAGIGK